MEDQYNRYNENSEQVNPRRKKRTKMQTLKETYLPVIIAGVALVLIIVFIIGAIVRSSQKRKFETAANVNASVVASEQQNRLDEEAAALLAQAEALAAKYDYAGAIAVLNSFSGDLSVYTNLNDKIIEYENAQKNLVTWDDISKVPNLSFQMLLEDPTRGYKYVSYLGTYGTAINRNFITTFEFRNILQQLYANGYVLVDFDDFIQTSTNAEGVTTFAKKSIILPKGKKPIMITQTNVNYNNYLIDSNKDYKPDANGGGFASKLLWDGTNFSNEMVDANGNTVTGDFDLVPILEKFIKEHPDFSHNGARATLALTGYNGLFGYRIQAEDKAGALTGPDRQTAIQDVKNVLQALQTRGYKLACYSYTNDYEFGKTNIGNIRTDLSHWAKDIVPILNELNIKADIFAYPQNSDISTDTGAYSGERFDILKENGFRYYLGFCNSATPWAHVDKEYIRQGRLMVTGANLAHNASWFAGLFDPATVLDIASRGTVPKPN